jgi:hypothetical protein
MQWVNNIVVKYIEEVKRVQGLPAQQYSILYIDAWSVHRSEAFRDWMQATHPLIRLIFVPATCTGILQPADVGLQRVIKHRLKVSAWLCHGSLRHVYRMLLHAHAEAIRPFWPNG